MTATGSIGQYEYTGSVNQNTARRARHGTEVSHDGRKGELALRFQI